MSVYVERRAGAVVGVYLNPQPGYAEEELADDHPEVSAFRAQPTPEQVRARVRAAALTSLLTRSDETAIAVRAMFAAVVTLFNDRLEALGQPRVLQAEILAFVEANPTIGDPLPGG